jgi:hypothetical protein
MMFRCTVVFFWKYGAPFRVLSLKIYCSPRHAAIKLVYPKFSRTNSYPIVLYNYIPINSLICSYLHYICIYISPTISECTHFICPSCSHSKSAVFLSNTWYPICPDQDVHLTPPSQ